MFQTTNQINMNIYIYILYVYILESIKKSETDLHMWKPITISQGFHCPTSQTSLGSPPSSFR